MSISTTNPPQFDVDERMEYTRPTVRALTDAQERLILQCAMLAQTASRLEVWWVNGQMHVQLIKTEDRRRA